MPPTPRHWDQYCGWAHKNQLDWNGQSGRWHPPALFSGLQALVRTCARDYKNRWQSEKMVREYALATEYFNIESTSIPYTHSKYHKEENCTPEEAVI